MKRLIVLLFALLPAAVNAQLSERVLGANHPELEWNEVYTEHFILTYHQGLEQTVKQAAPIAEEVYRVVTSNLGTPLQKRLRIYLSNVDEVKNAFASNDEYIYIWMRGILDDEPFAIRASGTSKWLRSVITHEFTHIVIEHATRDWTSSLFPVSLSVPRWFHEGLARFMEPDGWTPDLDIALRMAVVSGDLNLNIDRFLGGTLMYEGGQSLVRYIAATYGDSSIQKILKYRKGRTYNFDAAVEAVTKHSLEDVYDEWRKVLIVYYGTQYGTRDDISTIARKIPTDLAIVLAARLAPDGKRIAIVGKESEDDPSRLYILSDDTGRTRETLSTEPGIAPYLSWSPNGKELVVSKLRWGKDAALVYDLYHVDVNSGDLTRLTNSERAEQPDWSSTNKIVAVRATLSGSDLIEMNADGSGLRQITQFNDPDVNVYWPRWSPDGSRVLFSIFRKNGQRDIAIVTASTGSVQYLTNDSINDRYAVWSPHGDSVVFVSFASGIPNAYTLPASGGVLTPITNIASNVTPWDWPSTKDSVLVSSFAFRNSVQLYWIPILPIEARVATSELQSRYVSWRTVRLPLGTGPADLLSVPNVSAPSSYNSLAHVKPFLYFPLIGTDMKRSGEEGTQWGGGAVLRDDMGKHTIVGYALYGDVSKEISYELEYKNSQLSPDILLGASRTMGFDQVIADQEYYERETAYHLDLHLSLPSPDKLDASHEFALGAEYQSMEPWNLQAFDTVAPEHRPIPLKTITMVAKYDYFSNHVQTGLTAAHFDRKLGSDLTRTRVRGFFNIGVPLGDDDENEIGFVGHAAADFGDEVPQDFLGFWKYDEFEGGLNLVDLHVPDRLRGIRRYYYGNRLLYGSFEIRHHDPFFGSLVPVIKAFEPRLVEWIETGATWYANAPANNPSVTTETLSKTQWLKSAGIELRTEGVFGFSLAGGVGWELKSRVEPDWYFRLAGDL